MAEVQDDDQWLYGEDGAEKEAATDESTSKADAPADESDAAAAEKTSVPEERSESPAKESDAAADKEGTAAAGEDEAGADASAANGDKSGDGAAGESSDEDDLTITIGELKKAAEVMTPGQPHLARFQPKAAPTSGLKDEDFASAGKVNGVAVADLNLSDYEDKPWRKPGADLSDYFNYGFNEQTWFQYCYRQKRMRTTESGSGLNSLGINVSKPFGFMSNSDSKSNGAETNGSASNRPRPSGTFHRRLESQAKPEGNSIQVMTADRRQYSNKVLAPPFMSGPPPPIPQGPYDDMDFGGSMYGPPGADNGYYPPAPYFNTPPPSGPPPPVSGPPPNFNAPPVSWSNPPPPMVPPPQIVPPASHDGPPPPRWGGEVPPSPALTGGLPMLPGSPPPSYRADRDRDDSDEDRRRSRRHRRASRSPSRSRHRTRSRSRSPSHKHKRKKSKRDRDGD